MRPGPAPQPVLTAQRSGGAEGNERLTAMTGAVLLTACVFGSAW